MLADMGNYPGGALVGVGLLILAWAISGLVRAIRK